jgi:hypothetical protein
MPISKPPFVRLVGLASVFALASIGVFVSRASSSTSPMERDVLAAYPHTPEVSGSLSGVRVDELALSGLRVVAREDHPVEEGGIVLSFGDPAVKVVVELAVARDAAAARRFVDARLHDVATQLAAATDPAFGDYAFGDGDSIVIGAAHNVAWVVRALEGSPVRAREVITELRAKSVAGAPSFPTATVTLQAEVPLSGAELRVTSAAKYKVRAEGAYVAHGKTAPLVKPFGRGPVTLIATVVDDLGRVSEVRATAEAK